MSEVRQNVRSLTICYESYKLPGVGENVRSQSKCQESDQMSGAGQIVRSQTKIPGVRKIVRSWTTYPKLD